MAFQLQYRPVALDFCNYCPKGRNYESYPSPFLAENKAGWFIHGNSVTSVLDGDDDVSSRHNTWRRWRIWGLSLGGGLKPLGSAPYSPWEDDNRSNIPNWMDIPGFIFPKDSKAATSNERLMLEFVVAVDKHPDSGAVYFCVVISKEPRRYRVEMSSATPMAFQQWRDVSASRAPWVNVSTNRFEVDSGWADL
jgi:hypothetical protein